MVDEGIVYYKSSPALEGLGPGGVNTFGLDSDTSNDSSKTAHSKSVWMEWMRNLLKDNQVTEFTVACDLVDNIVQSGLLAEDHCAQVAALRDTNQQMSVFNMDGNTTTAEEHMHLSLAEELMSEGKSCPSEPSVERSSSSSTNSWPSPVMLASLVAVPLVGCAAALCGFYTFLLATTAAVLSLAGLLSVLIVLMKLNSGIKCRRLVRGREAVEQYCSRVDSLLRLLTDAVKYLQEMETLAKGYTRPVPLNVTAAHSYQEEGFTHCSVLRCTLYSVCSELAEDVRVSCCQLNKCSVDGFESGDLNRDTLSLSSLKESCHLFASLNSELLHTFCFKVMVTPLQGSSLDSSSRVLGNIVEMEPLVSALTNFVSCGHQKLKWAMMFENNLCTGDDSTLPVPVASPDDVPCPNQLVLLEGLQRMDKKGQLIVRNIRDGIVLLSQNEESSEDTLSAVRSHLDILSAHLSTLSRDVDDAQELLDGKNNDISSSSPSPIELSHDLMQGQPKDQNDVVMFRDHMSSGSSSDEQVYEMLVSREDGSSAESELGCGYLHEESSDIPQKMMTELKDVLTIRQVQKIKRRKLKRKRNKKALDVEHPVHCQGDPLHEVGGSEGDKDTHGYDSTGNEKTEHLLSHETCTTDVADSEHCHFNSCTTLHEADDHHNGNKSLKGTVYEGVTLDGEDLLVLSSSSEYKVDSILESVKNTSCTTQTAPFPPSNHLDVDVRQLMVASLTSALAKCKRDSSQADVHFEAAEDDFS